MGNYSSEAYKARRVKSGAIGKKAEEDFEKAAINENFFIILPKSEDDIDKHWDRKLIRDPIVEYVDVKAMKDVHSSGYTWVEKQNKYGRNGWLYSPELDYIHLIAFEKEDRFDLVDVLKLRKLIEEKVDFTKPILMNRVEPLSYMIYRVYWRNEDDRIILTPYEDIDKLGYHRVIYKV